MDEKDEIPIKLLCMSCLCVGRNLRVLSNEKLKRFYVDTINEIPLNNIPIISPYFCWECEIVIKKVVSFREQIQDSYRIFLTYPRENLHECLLTDVVRPPRLKQRTLSPVSIAPEKVPDQLEGSNEGNKEVKVELEDGDSINLSDTENSLPSDTDDALDAELETLLSKAKEKQNKSNVSKKVRKTHKSKILLNGLKISASKMVQEIRPVFCGQNYIYTVCEENLERCPLSDAISKSQNRSDSLLNNIEEVTTDTLKETELVKDELKLEWGKDNNADADLDVELEKLVSKVKDKKRCKVGSKIKQAKKLVKRLESQLKTTKPTKKVERPKIRTIELSYEEMLVERDRELERDSYVKAAYKCETCIIGFNYKNSLKAHVSAKHSPDRGDYICPICKTIISSVESFTAHHKRHMRRYECTICQKRTMDLKVMQQHYYSSHEISLKQYKCDMCGKISNSIDSHRYHKDSHKARVQCTECDKTFTHRAGLMNHRQSVHELKSAFPCTICDKVFRWKTSLRRHVEKHDVKDKSPTAAYCATCGVTFSSVCSYQRHMRNSLRHVTPEQLRFICDHCKRRFADKTKLRDHIEEKHLHKTYQCHICMKPSKNRVGLDQHIRNVHKGRPNNKMCHHCGKGFPTKVQLESHIRTHTGERPFICEFCPTTFSQQSNLYKHNRQVHLNIKTKRYPMCKKRKEDKPLDPPSSPPIDPYRPVAVLHYSPDRGFVM